MTALKELEVALDLLGPDDKRAEFYLKFVQLVKEHTGASNPLVVETAVGAAIDVLIHVFLSLPDDRSAAVAAENFAATILESTR